ncbi:hypothetical protein [Stutzerimonas xanthomarina]|uniref:Sel1 repeat-containing protein n=2 Tax=Stutzerimonas xanthomarina TaxID=271420 RepID=A0A1M5PNC6_9GAMM|nr:hypothetical protein [Stutzerimonas xanthomarina]MCP9338210.1 hypothetical protein [Stutzerimonas xanthomarina]SEH72956.1 hypothetical protein SAMN05216535_1510 [Stutzerimonas xanthomarina]SHH03305.1 hypothetical protein SAMN02744645_2301 [Stutzerimonas xanthomarina DSM 18231]
MKNALVIGLLVVLGGCASQPCDQYGSDGSCRAERLLYQNDLLQAKILISIGDENGYELAAALLERSARLDKRGETEFYQALLLIRQGPQPEQVLRLLEQASAKGHPHAVALLYKIYQEPYLLDERNVVKAEGYRQAYAGLDVAQSGYPSFEKALELVSQLVEPPPPLPERDDPCANQCL